MATTNYQFRLLIICPVGAKVTAIVNWLTANIDPDCVDPSLGPELCPFPGSPSDTATHRWCCGAFTNDQTKRILVRLATLADIEPPTNNQWNGWTRAQKLAWLASVRNSLKDNYGIYVMLSVNDETWDRFDDGLTAMGLQRRVTI